MGLGMQRCRLEGTPIVYHVDKTEGAPWVLLLHAAFVDHRMFRTQVEALRGRCSIIAVDILGHGGSTEARRGDSLESMASWLDAILEAEGKAEAILKVQQALADSIKLLNDANPNDQVVKIKALEAFQAAADGKATKIIIPSEIQGLAGLASSAKALLEAEK